MKEQQKVVQSAAVAADANKEEIGNDQVVVVKYDPLHEHSQMNVVVDDVGTYVSDNPNPPHLVRDHAAAYHIGFRLLPTWKAVVGAPETRTGDWADQDVPHDPMVMKAVVYDDMDEEGNETTENLNAIHNEVVKKIALGVVRFVWNPGPPNEIRA